MTLCWGLSISSFPKEQGDPVSIKNRINVGILSPLRMRDSQDGERILNLLIEELPEIKPEYVNNQEPIKTPFTTVEDAMERWSVPLLWKRKSKPRSEGSIWFDNPENHSCLYLSVEPNFDLQEPLVAFVVKCAALLDAHLAYVHLTGPAEARAEDVDYEMWHPYDLGLTTSVLHQGIPSLCWFTVFGSPYIDMIGCDRLMSVEAHEISELSRNLVSIKTTPSLKDVSADFSRFNRARKLQVEQIGRNYFWGRGKEGDPLVPRFEFR